MRTSLGPLVLAVLLLLIVPVDGMTQIGGITDRAKRAADREVNRAVNKVDRMIGDAVACAIGDTKCQQKAKDEGKPVVLVDDDGEPVTDQDGNHVSDPAEAEKLVQKPGEGVWRNYDFVPGATVWFATDFSKERVGRFPASQLEFVKGNMQIVELDGRRVLEATGASVFRVNLADSLPDAFTIEFRLKTGAPNMGTLVFFAPMETSYANYPHHYLNVYRDAGVYLGGNAVSSGNHLNSLTERLTPVKLQADGSYAIMYVGTDRAANMPNASFPSTNSIEFRMEGNANYPSYITDIVVAVGLDQLYDVLMETGVFVTRGIYFDFDSDVLRPESTPALEEIRSTLESHADLTIVIEGHTDDVGDADYNMELSDKRAQAVAVYLSANGIDGDRISAVGMGESDPMADNATPEGRAQNRRVVIKLAE